MQNVRQASQSPHMLVAVEDPLCVMFCSHVPRRTIHPLHATQPGLALFGPGRVSGRGL